MLEQGKACSSASIHQEVDLDDLMDVSLGAQRFTLLFLCQCYCQAYISLLMQISKYYIPLFRFHDLKYTVYLASLSVSMPSYSFRLWISSSSIYNLLQSGLSW